MPTKTITPRTPPRAMALRPLRRGRLCGGPGALAGCATPGGGAVFGGDGGGAASVLPVAPVLPVLAAAASAPSRAGVRVPPLTPPSWESLAAVSDVMPPTLLKPDTLEAGTALRRPEI